MIIAMHNELRKKLVWENVWKNALVVVVVLLSAPVVRTSLESIDKINVNDFLLAVSILLVTVCFANFAFTYKDSQSRAGDVRLLSHAATFLFLLLTALLLLTMSIGVGIAYPAMGSLFSVFSTLLYIAVMLYDFWDILRAN